MLVILRATFPVLLVWPLYRAVWKPLLEPQWWKWVPAVCRIDVAMSVIPYRKSMLSVRIWYRVLQESNVLPSPDDCCSSYWISATAAAAEQDIHRRLSLCSNRYTANYCIASQCRTSLRTGYDWEGLCLPNTLVTKNVILELGVFNELQLTHN